MINSLFYNRLYDWYERNHRTLPWRETEDGYRIWLSEVILQQTRVAQGLDYYLSFVNRWPTVEALADASEDEVLREWQGLGYYSRARNLHKAAKMVVERGWTPFPTRFEDIRQLPGVGEYTAGAIASFAYNQPYVAMDGNVYRVLARLFDIDDPFDTTAGKKRFRTQGESILDRDNPRLYNSSLMEFGALHCTPTLGNNCQNCPLQTFCLAYAKNTAELLPVRKPRPQLRDRWFDYHIYLSRKKKVDSRKQEVFTLIHQREDKDIWYHLYEFPYTEYREAPSTKDLPKDAQVVGSFTHVLSHQRIRARFLLYKMDELPSIAGTQSVPVSELNQYALSRLTLRALEQLHLYP